MTNVPHKVFGAISESAAGGFSGNIHIDGYAYRVFASAEKRVSPPPKSAVYQSMTFSAETIAPAASATVFRSEIYERMVDKPGIQLMCNYGPERELLLMTGFYKTHKKNGELAKTPFYSLRLSRPNPATLTDVTPSTETDAPATTLEGAATSPGNTITSTLAADPAVAATPMAPEPVTQETSENATASSSHEEEEDQNLVYDNDTCNAFVAKVRDLGFEVRHYVGRFFWTGPAVIVRRGDEWDIESLSEALEIRLQQDSMGMNKIVYPVAHGRRLSNENLNQAA